MGQWEAVPEHSTTSTLRAPTGPAWPLGLPHGRTPCSPHGHQPPTRWCCSRACPQVPTVCRPWALPSQAHVQPCHCGPAWQSLLTMASGLAWARTCPITTRIPGSWLDLAPICMSVPLTFLCEPWGARQWHRELHSFWHLSCWIMCKVLTACEHLKFPSYLFHQNRALSPGLFQSDSVWVVTFRLPKLLVGLLLLKLICMEPTHSGKRIYCSSNFFVFVLF